MPDLGVVRHYAELFVRMGLIRSEGGDYVPACTECVEYLDGLLGDGRDGILGFIVFMCVVRDLFNDEFISTYMDLTYAELILKHVLDRHEDTVDQ
jgi:hypothetical protein